MDKIDYKSLPLIGKGNYMIREYIDGPNIKDFISINGLNNDLSKELTELYSAWSKRSK